MGGVLFFCAKKLCPAHGMLPSVAEWPGLSSRSGRVPGSRWAAWGWGPCGLSASLAEAGAPPPPSGPRRPPGVSPPRRGAGSHGPAPAWQWSVVSVPSRVQSLQGLLPRAGRGLERSDPLCKAAQGGFLRGWGLYKLLPFSGGHGWAESRRHLLAGLQGPPRTRAQRPLEPVPEPVAGSEAPSVR